ncbi:MAG: hypothetical protein Q8Q12_21840 [bacterium]|nr:hypothetical protein [bacterium]
MNIVQCVVVGFGYILTLATSGVVVRHFIGSGRPAESGKSPPERRYDTGAIIGKCENLLTITLILADAFTGLALIFAAKSIVRSEKIKENATYYLGGTLVNFTYSVLMGFLIRLVLGALDC